MDIKDIALKNMLRRKGKAAFVLAGLVIGVATVVGVITYIDTMTAEINDKLEKYGANILIVPKTDMVQQLSEALPMAKVMAIQKVVKSRMETLGQFKQFSFGISAVVALVGDLVVLVTLMGSVRERRREIGIFRAIGFRKQHIMRIIFLEAGVVSLLAGALGYGLGIAGAALGFRLFGGHTGGVSLDPMLASSAVLMAVSVGLIASVYPAVMASRLDPNEALKAL